jgi:uncharacterized membrane protein SpoIIM required for sporulation
MVAKMNRNGFWRVLLVVAGLGIIGVLALLVFFGGGMPLGLLVAAPFVVLAREAWKRAEAPRTEFT